MSSEAVISHVQGAITTITVNRPDKLNALNQQVIAGLERAFEAAASNPDCRVVVLTGAGDRAFVAGADIAELQALDAAAARAFLQRGHALMQHIENLGKPVIAAVNGFALGGGCELALACTLRVAADGALLGLPEVKLGLIPGYGGTQRLVRTVGASRALHMMLSGNPVKAEQALQYGLVTQVVPASELPAVVEKLAAALAASAPLAMRGIIAAVNGGAGQPLEQGLALEIDEFVKLCSSEDMREGTSAFLEKRPAVFKGR
jgi:enoyl-CoA hydratase